MPSLLEHDALHEHGRRHKCLNALGSVIFTGVRTVSVPIAIVFFLISEEFSIHLRPDEMNTTFDSQSAARQMMMGDAHTVPLDLLLGSRSGYWQRSRAI